MEMTAPKSVTVVPIERVKYTHGYLPGVRSLKKIKEILQAQGLIEPICIDANWHVDRLEVYGNQRLEAARALGWDTVIVVNAQFR